MRSILFGDGGTRFRASGPSPPRVPLSVESVTQDLDSASQDQAGGRAAKELGISSNTQQAGAPDNPSTPEMSHVHFAAARVHR